jgi:hypothetical protein
VRGGTLNCSVGVFFEAYMFMYNVGVCYRRLVCSFIYFTVFHKYAWRMNFMVPITKLSDEASSPSAPQALLTARV